MVVRVKGGSSLRAKQRHQAIDAVQRRQVVVAAHMGVANIDLRNGAPARAFHHDGALGGVQVYAYFLDMSDAALLEQHFGADAIGADGGAVHRYGCHGFPLPVRSWESVLFGQRQSALEPAAQPAFQADRLLITLFAQRTGNTGRIAALVADDDDGLVFGQRAQLGLQIGFRQTACLGYAAGLERIVAADIQENPLVLIGQLYRLLYAHRLGAAFQQIGQRHPDARGNGDEYEYKVALVKKKVHDVTRKPPGKQGT